MSIERYDCNSEMYHSHYGSFVRFDDHEAELAAERARADALQARVAQWEYSAKYDDIHYYALKADRDRLRAAIEQAPHDMDCESVRIKDDGYGPVMVDAFPLRPCNCWKRAVLGERMEGGQ